MIPIRRIGFVGVGRMGAPMASHLARTGFDVLACDPSPGARERVAEAGVACVETVDQLGARDLTLLMLPGDDAVQAVADVLLERLEPGQVLVDMGTSRIETARRLARAATERRAFFLDAPVSGGESGARAATLSIMVGGDADAFERCGPVFSALGQTVTRIGESGMGLVAKYVNQMLVEITACAVAEGLALAQTAGADPAAVFQAVRHGLAGSRILELLAPQILADDFGAGRELTLVQKDTGYVLDAAAEVGAWTPLTDLCHGLFTDALAQGQGEGSAGAVSRLWNR